MDIKHGNIVFSSISDSAGFFSNYFSVLSTVVECLKNRIDPYIDTSNTWFNPTCNFETCTVEDPNINPWNWWFDQKFTKRDAEELIFIFRSNIDQNPLRFALQPDLDYFREVAEKYCPIRSHILEEEELLYKHYIQNKNTLGILARGTEMLVHHLEYPKVQPKGWPDLISFYLDQHSDIDNIFLVSDDLKIIESILKVFPETKYLKHFFRSSNQTEEELSDKIKPWWLSSPDDNPAHRKRIGEECLIQTRLLARCNYFLGSHSGMTSGANFFNKKSFKQIYIV